MENRLKRDTKPVLEELSAAHIRSVMVTGIRIGWIVLTADSADMEFSHMWVSKQSAALSPVLVRRHRHLCPSDNYRPRSTCAVTITWVEPCRLMSLTISPGYVRYLTVCPTCTRTLWCFPVSPFTLSTKFIGRHAWKHIMMNQNGTVMLEQITEPCDIY